MTDTDQDLQQEGAQADEAIAGDDESAVMPESGAPVKARTARRKKEWPAWIRSAAVTSAALV